MLVGSEEGEFEVGDSSEPVVEGVDVNTVQVEEVEADEAIVSMCATSSNPNLPTMKLKGEVVANKAIFALLDSGSTHSFINPVVIDGIKCKLVKTNPMVVTVANGKKIDSYAKGTGLSILSNEESPQISRLESVHSLCQRLVEEVME